MKASRPSPIFWKIVSTLSRLSLASLAALVLVPVTCGAGSCQDKPTATSWQQALTEGRRRIDSKEYSLAEACFRQAVKYSRRQHASFDDRALCVDSLAEVLQMQEQTEESLDLYKKGLRMLQKAHGKDGEKLLPVLLALGDVYRTETEYRHANKMYKRALAISRANSGQASLQTADIEHRVGMVAAAAGFTPRAEQMYWSSLDTIMQQPKLQSSDLLQAVLNDYIQLLRGVHGGGKPLSSALQAELLKDRLDEIDRTKTGGESAFSKQVSIQMLQAEGAGGAGGAEKFAAADSAAQASSASPAIPISAPSNPDFVASEQISKQRIDFYERMVAIDIRTLGENHPSVARDLTGLAYLLALQNNLPEARKMIDRASAIYSGTYGADPLLVRRTALISKLIERKEKSESGAEPVKDYLSSLPAIPDRARTFEVSVRLANLALSLYCEGKITEAEKIAAWALVSTAGSCGEESALTGASLNDYARVLRSGDRAAEAERYERAADEILTNSMARKAAALVP